MSKHLRQSKSKPHWADSIRKAAEAAWLVTTKFRHPHKLKLKWLYRNMVNRCHKPGTRRYERYGGRGISVCQSWRLNPTAFFEWAASHGYSPGLQINRKDNDGDYTPENCEFCDRIKQQSNTSRSHFLERYGRRLTVSQWARELGVRQQALQHRVSRGWSIERIFSQPFRRSRRC